MQQAVPHQAAESFLLALLRRAELAAARGGEATAGRTWNENAIPPEEIDACRRLLLESKRIGAVDLVRGTGFRAHQIRRVQVKDANLLAGLLGQTRYADRLTAMDAALHDVVEGAEAWVGDVLDQCRSRWTRGEPAFGLPSDDVKAARETLQILRAIADDRHRGKDLRSFSIEVTGRSKALEERRQHVVAALRKVFSISEDAGADEILEVAGFQKFHQPLLIRASLEIGGVPLEVRPYIGLPPEMAAALKLRPGFASYLIGIENLTSFNRYVREIEDDGAVIYTGGFPSRPVLTAFADLAAAAGRVFHWGDIDPGGIRIFRTLERVVPGLRPHMMDPETARIHGREAAGEAALAGPAFCDSAIAETAIFLSQDRTWRLEQEALAPTPPPRGPTARIS